MHPDPSESFLPLLEDQLLQAVANLVRVRESLDAMRRSPVFIDEVIWQTRWRHRDECEAEVERISRALIARRSVLVQAIVDQMPLTDAWQRLDYANRLSDLEPHRLELLARIALKPTAISDPRSVTAATRAKTRFLEFATITVNYRAKHGVGLTRHGLAREADLAYSTVDGRLRALERAGYDIEDLLAGLAGEAAAKPGHELGQPAG